MKTLTKALTIGCSAALLFIGQATASEASVGAERLQRSVVADASLPWIKGKVVKISQKRGVVTIAHEEISNLSMPSMTMGFKTDDTEALEALQPGDEIEFQTQKVDGKLTLVHYRHPAS